MRKKEPFWPKNYHLLAKMVMKSVFLPLSEIFVQEAESTHPKGGEKAVFDLQKGANRVFFEILIEKIYLIANKNTKSPKLPFIERGKTR